MHQSCREQKEIRLKLKIFVFFNLLLEKMLDCTKQTSSDHVESHLQLNSIVNSSFFFPKNFKGNCFY